MANKRRISYGLKMIGLNGPMREPTPSQLPMDEGRKKVITLVAGMFLCRQLLVLLGRTSPARETAFHDGIRLAGSWFAEWTSAGRLAGPSEPPGRNLAWALGAFDDSRRK
jgi:hypothetical protein